MPLIRHVVPMLLLPVVAACAGRPVLPAAAIGQHFYAFETGYRCRTFSPDPAGIPSWVDHLEVRDTMIVRWGNRCQDAGRPLSAAQAAAVRAAADGSTLVLDGRTYTRSADPAVEAARGPAQ